MGDYRPEGAFAEQMQIERMEGTMFEPLTFLAFLAIVLNVVWIVYGLYYLIKRLF